MFCERLNRIFDILQSSNAQIARESGIDPSIVSRFRAGKRVPRRSSLQFLQLCNGIAEYTEKNHLEARLSEICLFSEGGNLSEQINFYLLPEEAHTRLQKTKKAEPISKMLDSGTLPISSFSERLTALMKMLSITNIRLAKYLNVDSSLISRYKSGFRTPQKNSEMIFGLCSYLIGNAITSGCVRELSQMTGISLEDIYGGGGRVAEYLADWILGRNESSTEITDSFLGKLDSLSVGKTVLPPAASILPDGILCEKTGIYSGIEGLRRAVLRFLGTAALTESVRDLKLYSDQNMEWLTGNPAFLQQWAILMNSVLHKQIKIQVIHNIDRSLPEMLAAVENWLPLYMTGLIESFYCKKSGDGRFSHTLFIAPRYAAVSSSLVTGSEDEGKYYYNTEPENVMYQEKQFDALLGRTKTLVQVFNQTSIINYNLKISEMDMQPGITKKLLNCPSLATMPRSLLERILQRNSVEPEKINKVLSIYEVRVKQFEKELHSGGIIECMALPDMDTLAAGKVTVNLLDAFLRKEIYYTSDEFAEHLISILSILNHTSQYNLIPLQQRPFEHIQLILKSGVGAMALKSDDPVATFWFAHPLMGKAFEEYLDSICERSAYKNKVYSIDLLNKYINSSSTIT